MPVYTQQRIHFLSVLCRRMSLWRRCSQPLFYDEHSMRTGPLQCNVLDDSDTEGIVRSTFLNAFPFEAAVEKLRRQFEVRADGEALATDAALYVQPRVSQRYGIRCRRC